MEFVMGSTLHSAGAQKTWKRWMAPLAVDILPFQSVKAPCARSLKPFRKLDYQIEIIEIL